MERKVRYLEANLGAYCAEVKHLSGMINNKSPRLWSNNYLFEKCRSFSDMDKQAECENEEYFRVTGKDYEGYLNIEDECNYVVDSLFGEAGIREDMLGDFDGRVWDEE